MALSAGNKQPKAWATQKTVTFFYFFVKIQQHKQKLFS